MKETPSAVEPKPLIASLSPSARTPRAIKGTDHSAVNPFAEMVRLTGRNPPSYDKQFVRDWLETTGWDKTPPAPELPSEVVARTREKYLEAYRALTGRELRDE